MKFTVNDYYMGRDQTYPGELSPFRRASAATTVARANALLEAAAAAGVEVEGRYITSGWRPMAVNATTPGAATFSRHITCEAIDISDPFGDLDEWALDHPGVLERVELWQEHPSATKGWAHFQIVPPRSGKRVFYP